MEINKSLQKGETTPPSTPKQEPIPEKFQPISKNNFSLVFHAIRVFVKLGIIVALFIDKQPLALILSAYLVLSEILDQLSRVIAKRFQLLNKFVPYFYVLNSITVITAVAYFSGWVLNDFYLVYLIHISSATFGYGFKVGLFSFILSTTIYTYLLYLNFAGIITYLRLPLFSIFAIRLMTSQLMYERSSTFLSRVLSLEKSKQDFIGIASHNLRTPVAAIYGYINLLIRGDAGKLNDNQSLYVQRIKENNQELELLTEKLLQISILEIGEEVNLLKQPSQIEVIINDVITKFESVAKSKHLSLRFEKQSGLLPLVNIDVEKVSSVLSNLVDNALKYTEKGEVVVKAEQLDTQLQITIKDTGVGIPKAELSNIFNKFYRSGNILVYNQVGTGLGLFLGKKIIELHGGKISVTSQEGKGSQFQFTIPIIKED